MTKEKLFEIISFAENAGFPVVAMVSDLGGGNRGLHKDLNISISQTSFANPVNQKKIYVFADVPHLMKLLRNYCVDQGFIVNNTEINKEIIENLIHLKVYIRSQYCLQNNFGFVECKRRTKAEG